MAGVLVGAALVLILGLLAFGGFMLRKERREAEGPAVIKSVPLVKTKWKPTPHRSGGGMGTGRKLSRWAGRWIARHRWTIKAAA